jgi:hypothetical protein
MSAGSVAGGNTTFAPSMASKPKSYLDHIRTRRKKPKTYILTPAQASSSSCQYERHAAWSGPMRGARGGTYWVNQRSGEKTYEDPGTGKAKAKQAVGAVVKAAASAEHKVSSVFKAALAKLPKPVQAIVGASWKATMAGYSAGRKAAVEAAVNAGTDRRKAEQIGKTVGMIDLMLSKGVFAGTLAAGAGAGVASAAAFIVPAASMGYLAFSTAKNPSATLEWARKAIRKVRGAVRYEREGGDWVSGVAKLAAHSRNADAFLALFAASLDEMKGDPDAALELVGQAWAASNPTQTYGRALVERYAFQFQGPRSGKTRTVWTKNDLPKSVLQSGAYQEVHAHEREKQAKESLPYKQVKRQVSRVNSNETLEKMTQRVADVKWDVLRHVAYTLGIKGRSRQDIINKVAAWAHGRVKEKGEEQPEEKPQEQPQKPASKLDSLKAGLASLAGKHAAATDVAALGEHLTQMAERMKGAKASQGVAEREGWDANAGMTPAGIARADQYLAGLGKAPPKPAPGHVRLYRGTNKGETAHESSFWTDERGLKGVAVPFASGHNRQLVYVDVPEAEAKKYLLGGAVTEGEYAGLPESLRKAAKTWGTPGHQSPTERPAAAQQPSENAVNKSGALIPAPKAAKPKQLTLAQKARMARLERQKASHGLNSSPKPQRKPQGRPLLLVRHQRRLPDCPPPKRRSQRKRRTRHSRRLPSNLPHPASPTSPARCTSHATCRRSTTAASRARSSTTSASTWKSPPRRCSNMASATRRTHCSSRSLKTSSAIRRTTKRRTKPVSAVRRYRRV